jgi:predicted metal-dependent phosphoesterase TrpH
MTSFPPARVTGRGRGWYRGDCHVHSARSHAADQTPAQLAAEALALGLDFIAATEHNTAAEHARAAVAANDLLVVLGQEVTTRTGHWVALGLPPDQEVEWRYGIRDDMLDRHLAAVREAGGLCVAAHPHAPYPSGLLLYPFHAFDLVEVWNGLWRSDRPYNADNEAALAEWSRGLAAGLHRGRWQPAIGNSDAHLAGQLGRPHTVVHAEELSTTAVLAGLRAATVGSRTRRPSNFPSRPRPATAARVSARACPPAASRSWHGLTSAAYRPARSASTPSKDSPISNRCPLTDPGQSSGASPAPTPGSCEYRCDTTTGSWPRSPTPYSSIRS